MEAKLVNQKDKMEGGRVFFTPRGGVFSPNIRVNYSRGHPPFLTPFSRTTLELIGRRNDLTDLTLPFVAGARSISASWEDPKDISGTWDPRTALRRRLRAARAPVRAPAEHEATRRYLRNIYGGAAGGGGGGGVMYHCTV